jgi:hypothetical protein
MHNKAKEQLIAALSRFYRSEHPIRATVTVQQWKKGPVVFQLRPLTASSAYCYFTRVRSGGNEDPTITPGGVANPPSASGEGRAGAAPWLGLMSAAAMGTDELLDHLIVSAMECGLESGAAGRPGKPAVLGLPEVQSALSEPVRGVRLSESTLNFGVVSRCSIVPSHPSSRSHSVRCHFCPLCSLLFAVYCLVHLFLFSRSAASSPVLP